MADEMGLGKTVCCLTSMAGDKADINIATMYHADVDALKTISRCG
jgi:hypothetical protein